MPPYMSLAMTAVLNMFDCHGGSYAAVQFLTQPLGVLFHVAPEVLARHYLELFAQLKVLFLGRWWLAVHQYSKSIGQSTTTRLGTFVTHLARSECHGLHEATTKFVCDLE